MVASREITLQQPIKEVLRKWIDDNNVVHGLIYSRGEFYDFVVSRMPGTESAPTTADHLYNPLGVISFSEFVKRSRPNNKVDIISFFENFKPASVDPERLFSYGRLTKNYLQNRLTTENHSRNVFINKNMHLLQ